MKSTPSRPFALSVLLPRLVVAAAAVLPVLASAQWQWIDANGIPVFSDRAPPSTVPRSRIVKMPASRQVDYAVTPIDAPKGGDAPVAAAPKAAASATAPRDTKADELAKQKMRQDQERQDAQRAENCKRAQEGMRPFDAGVRITRLNAKGEREFLDDTQRQIEVKRLQAVIDSECSPLPKPAPVNPSAGSAAPAARAPAQP